MPLQCEQKPGKPVKKQDPKRYKCEHDGCLKVFTRKAGLSKHHLSHTGLRPHKCEWPGCSKGFNQRSALGIHWNTHTRAKPYPCGFCPQRFGDPANRTRHRDRLHGKIVACICQHCDVRIQRVDHFFTHLQKRHDTDWWKLSSEQHPDHVRVVYKGKALPMPYSFPHAEDSIPDQSAPRHSTSLDSSDSAWDTPSLGDSMLNSASSVNTHHWSQASSVVEYGTVDLSTQGIWWHTITS